MRASALALLSAAALASAQDGPYGIIVVEKVDPEAFNGRSNSTVNVYLTEAYENPEILGEVSTLYQIYPWYSYFCFAYKPDGTAYSDDWFGTGKPLHLSSENVPVSSIQCNAE
ncbi:hypothetical protein EKO27_g1288 [Xylaria grammica]|uniref:AA1-like domain-containing protein n=1 Tax=Xylaria grammica TaxID=363999 RepID=A0A439DHC6_9PEZI|nr:hypothetical protein EKO27_g1288 [Xylaria grammica]